MCFDFAANTLELQNLIICQRLLSLLLWRERLMTSTALIDSDYGHFLGVDLLIEDLTTAHFIDIWNHQA